MESKVPTPEPLDLAVISAPNSDNSDADSRDRFHATGVGKVAGRGTVMSPHIHSSAADELFALQVAQLKHDEFYHREIARLTVHARVNHMALHFCKYVGQLGRALQCDDKQTIRRTITDFFVIGLSCANILGLRLGTAIAEAQGAACLKELGQILLKQSPSGSAGRGEWLLLAYAVDAGQVARACEKLDHLEAYPFREEINKSVAAICRTSLMAAEVLGFDMPRAIKERFEEVEPAYLFHNAV
jgi:hypothetical protein